MSLERQIKGHPTIVPYYIEENRGAREFVCRTSLSYHSYLIIPLRTTHTATATTNTRTINELSPSPTSHNNSNKLQHPFFFFKKKQIIKENPERVVVV